MHPRLNIALDPLEGKSDVVLILLLCLFTVLSAILALVASVIYVATRKKTSLTIR